MLDRFAVLVPVVPRRGEDHVLLTKRPESLRSFSGHVSLPGGRREPEDADLAATALRETREEVGIEPAAIEIVRELPWQRTGLGHLVKPFVGRVQPSPAIKLCPREVERVLWLPRRRIERSLFRRRSVWIDELGHEHAIWTFDLDGDEVWGLTARILLAAFVDDRDEAGDPAASR